MLTAIHVAAGGRLLAFDPGLDDIRRAADAGGDPDGRGRTIQGARAAFHAAVEVPNFHFFARQFKNPMGADALTHTAPHTRFGIKLKRRHFWQISECFHMVALSFFFTKRPMAENPGNPVQCTRG